MFNLDFRFIFVVLAMLAGGASILQSNHYPPWPAFYSEYLGFVSLFFVFLVSLGWSGLYLSRPVFYFVVGAFIPLLQWSGGVIFFGGDALLACAYLLSFATALAVGLSGALGGVANRGLVVAAWSLVVVATLSAGMALCQWLSVGEKLPFLALPAGSRPYANLGQSNNLATMLSMALIAILYLYEKRQLGSLVGVFFAVFLIFGVALTQSRTPWLASFAVFFFWILKAPQCRSRGSWRMMLAWCVLYGVFVIVLPYLSDLLLLSNTSLLQRLQSLHRLELWWQLAHAVLQGPIVGYGWNQVSVAQVGISQAYPVQLMTEHSHNVLLDLLIWNGPVLGGLVITVLAVWLVQLAWRVRTVDSLCCMLAVGVVLVHGLVEFPLEYAFFLLPMGLLLGCVMAENTAGSQLMVPRYLAVGWGGVFAIGLAGVWHEYRTIEEDHRLMRFETASIGEVRAKQAAPEVLLLTQLREFIHYARTPAVEGMSAVQLAWMEKVAYRYPYSPSLVRYALALALNGRSKEADEQLLILRALHGVVPYNKAVHAFEALSDSYPQLREMDILSRSIRTPFSP